MKKPTQTWKKLWLDGNIMKKPTQTWKKWWLDYFDWNQDGKTNWWEYLIPFIVILIIEIIAELISNLIIYG